MKWQNFQKKIAFYLEFIYVTQRYEKNAFALKLREGGGELLFIMADYLYREYRPWGEASFYVYIYLVFTHGFQKFKKKHEYSELLGRRARMCWNPAFPIYRLQKQNLSATGGKSLKLEIKIFIIGVHVKCGYKYKRLL